jgi:hypothetical protein
MSKTENICNVHVQYIYNLGITFVIFDIGVNVGFCFIISAKYKAKTRISS